jgi:hypothetical protein
MHMIELWNGEGLSTTYVTFHVEVCQRRRSPELECYRQIDMHSPEVDFLLARITETTLKIGSVWIQVFPL